MHLHLAISKTSLPLNTSTVFVSVFVGPPPSHFASLFSFLASRAHSFLGSYNLRRTFSEGIAFHTLLKLYSVKSPSAILIHLLELDFCLCSSDDCGQHAALKQRQDLLHYLNLMDRSQRHRSREAMTAFAWFGLFLCYRMISALLLGTVQYSSN